MRQMRMHTTNENPLALTSLECLVSLWHLSRSLLSGNVFHLAVSDDQDAEGTAQVMNAVQSESPTDVNTTKGKRD